MPRQNKKPAPVPPDDLSEQTANQSISPSLWGGGILWGSGGSCANPCGYPGYESGYLRNYATYDWMLRHPVIRHARHAALGRALSSELDYKKASEDVPDARVDLLRRNIDPLWSQLLENGLLRGRDKGWSPFEPIWDTAGGEWRLLAVKPLARETTQIIGNDAGGFTGLSASTLRTGEGRVESNSGLKVAGLPAPYKAWVYTHDGECGNLYGRAWLENIRETAWKDWLDCAQQLQKLSGKVAGVQAVGMAPIKKKADIEASIKALANGAAGVYLETFPFSIPQDKLTSNPDLWKIIFELTKNPLSSITPLDFGSTTPAIAGLLARMRHDEELMFEGCLMSPRTGMEGQHGTKAEAETHKDSGVTIAELYLDNFAQQLQPIADAILVLNYGPDASGSVLIDPPPLEDAKADRAQTVFTTLAAVDTPIARAAAKMIDWPRVLQDMDAPLLEGVKFELEAPVNPNVPDPNGVPVKQGLNGNGNSPRVKKTLRRLGLTDN